MARIVLPLVALVAFFTFSDYVALQDGFFGFLTLALRERWGMQLLVDVGISITLFTLWMFRDAKEQRITPWPYLVACLSLGSIGALAYLVHRGVKQYRAERALTRATA